MVGRKKRQSQHLERLTSPSGRRLASAFPAKAMRAADRRAAPAPTGKRTGRDDPAVRKPNRAWRHRCASTPQRDGSSSNSSKSEARSDAPGSAAADFLRLVDGKPCNSETMTLLAKFAYGGSDDFGSFRERLYKTKKGAHLLVGSGHGSTAWY